MGANEPTSDSLTQTGDLGIAYIAYWVPAMLLALYMCFKHGFGRSSAWFWIMLLGLARVLGNAFLIADQLATTKSQGLATGSAVLGAVGISILLSAVDGLIVRLFEHMNREPIFNLKLIRLIYIAITLAVVLSILGGIKAEQNMPTPTFLDPNPTPDSDYYTGFKLLKAAIILLFATFAVLTGLLALVVMNFRYIPDVERKALYTALACMPFTLIRLIYAVIAIFKNSSKFNLFDPYVWTEAFLAALPEFIVGGLIIAVGFLLPKWPKQDQYNGKDVEVQNYPQQYPNQYPQQGYEQQQQPYPPQQEQAPQQYPPQQYPPQQNY